jgi:hypothetical protein
MAQQIVGVQSSLRNKPYLKYQYLVKMWGHGFLLHLCSLGLLFAVRVTHGHISEGITVPILYCQVAALDQPAISANVSQPKR